MAEVIFWLARRASQNATRLYPVLDTQQKGLEMRLQWI